jgi:hypothetical protein
MSTKKVFAGIKKRNAPAAAGVSADGWRGGRPERANLADGYE